MEKVYILKYFTNFDESIKHLEKQKVYSTFEKAIEYVQNYHVSGFKLTHYKIEVEQVDTKPGKNNHTAYENKEVKNGNSN